jgi:tyrosine decarboxylase / aspartate 1-decarboxylase
VSDRRWLAPFAPELDIVVWAPRANSATEVSELSQRVFDAAAKQDLHLALIHLPTRFFASLPNAARSDCERVLCLRSVLMKPEHRDWLDRIWAILSSAADEVLTQ